MNLHMKNLIISPIIGVFAYLIIGYIENQILKIPSTPVELIVLMVIITAVLIGCMMADTGGSPTKASRATSTSGVTGATGEENGTVKWFNIKKGYGFITRDAGDDVFVHYRNIQGAGRRGINEGQRVRFVVVNGDKGLQADEVEAL